jgi:hypothetical protein
MNMDEAGLPEDGSDISMDILMSLDWQTYVAMLNPSQYKSVIQLANAKKTFGNRLDKLNI